MQKCRGSSKIDVKSGTYRRGAPHHPQALTGDLPASLFQYGDY